MTIEDDEAEFLMGTTPVASPVFGVIAHKVDLYRQDVVDVLQDAATRGFETVVVLGLMNGEVSIRSSANVSRLELLGAIEYAKHHVCTVD